MNTLEEIIEKPDDESIKYWNKVSEMIWNFVKDVDLDKLEILGDCTHNDQLYDLKCKKYKFVNSRYYLGTGTHAEYVKLLNEEIWV